MFGAAVTQPGRTLLPVAAPPLVVPSHRETRKLPRNLRLRPAGVDLQIQLQPRSRRQTRVRMCHERLLSCYWRVRFTHTQQQAEPLTCNNLRGNYDSSVHSEHHRIRRTFIDGSTRDKLMQSDMNGIPLPVPPLDEQRAIVAFLERETERVDRVGRPHRSGRSSSGCEEYRTALITAARSPRKPRRKGVGYWRSQALADRRALSLCGLSSGSSQGARSTGEWCDLQHAAGLSGAC